jgi:hypothetical protein
LSVGFSDQAHLCRLFRQAFGQSPAHWRREREIPYELTSRTGMDENIPPRDKLDEGRDRQAGRKLQESHLDP